MVDHGQNRAAADAVCRRRWVGTAARSPRLPPAHAEHLVLPARGRPPGSARLPYRVSSRADLPSFGHRHGGDGDGLAGPGGPPGKLVLPGRGHRERERGPNPLPTIPTPSSAGGTMNPQRRVLSAMAILLVTGLACSLTGTPAAPTTTSPPAVPTDTATPAVPTDTPVPT